jgi:hypothetical protein
LLSGELILHDVLPCYRDLILILLGGSHSYLLSGVHTAATYGGNDQRIALSISINSVLPAAMCLFPTVSSQLFHSISAVPFQLNGSYGRYSRGGDEPLCGSAYATAA